MAKPIPLVGGSSGAAPSIYLVDEDTDVRAWGESVLCDLGVPIHSFSSGRAFLASVPEGSVGAVLLDLALPDVHGLQVLESIRGRGSHVKAVVLTESNKITDAVQSMRAGASNFLQKPPYVYAVQDAIKIAIDESRANAIRAAERRAVAERLARLDAAHATVLRLSVQGLAVKAIARQLEIGQRTAERYRAEALSALGVQSVLDAVDLYHKADGDRILSARCQPSVSTQHQRSDSTDAGCDEFARGRRSRSA